jgi:hypothetical protein
MLILKKRGIQKEKQKKRKEGTCNKKKSMNISKEERGRRGTRI